MDLRTALSTASEQGTGNIVGVQIHGRSIEVYRPRFCKESGKCRVEYREGALFHDFSDRNVFDAEHLPGDAAQVNYFVAPLSDEELDAVIDQQAETLLHRLLDGAPDPRGCQSPRDKAAFTSWCISTLAQHNS